jgi:DNA polymerase-3 subunit beta
MKISISQSELQRGLSRIQSIVEKRNTMPILASVLLDARQDGVLELAATDLEVGVRSSHAAEVRAAGRVAAPAKKLYEIVRELPDETVAIEVTADAYLGIRCARAQFTLAGSSAEEYPDLPNAAPGEMVPVQAVVLSQMIGRTLYAASTDETRYNLNGVFVEQLAESGKLRMVATDGHRLAYVDRALAAPLSGLGRGVIIPRKGLLELKRLVDEEDAEEVEIGFEGNSGLARKHGVTLVMRLVEGEFPSYQQVIPRQAGEQLVLPSEALAQALRRVQVLSSERSHAVKFSLAAGSLVLSSSSADLGEAREELDVDYSGTPLEIAFNAKYLMDCLAMMGAKEVRLGFQDPLSPAQIAPTDDADTFAVVMPMRV